ncbi:MAG: glycosyltransferase family 2 protein, partial [Bacteroidaceae bacterium]
MLSIIIPFHNRADLMTRMLDSLVPVRDDRVEIIFVDNNSDTPSKEKIAHFIESQQKHANPTAFSLVAQTKRGAPAARNKGLSVAKGEYVCFFDSDDTFSPDVLDEFFDVIKTGSADVIALHTFLVANGVVRRKNNTSDMDAAVHLVANRFATQSFILNRQFALEKATWNETLYYWNDLEWAFRILLSFSSFKWLKGCYHYIHHHAQSITGTSFSSRLPEILKAHDEI